jgi:hypothetical protein
MGTVISNLKAKFGVDTSDFKKGLKDGQKATSDFKDAAGSTLDEFASMFGIQMSSVTSAINTTGKTLNFLGSSFKAAAKGGDILTISMKVLKWAVVSTGLGALIVALGSLIAYFGKTGEGSDKFAKIMMQLRSVIDNVIDRLAIFGKGLWDIMTGKFKKGWEEMTGAFKGMGEEIKNDWKAAGDLADKLDALDDKEIAIMASQEKRKTQAEELLRKAKEETDDAREKLRLLQESKKIYAEYYSNAISLEEERLSLMRQQLVLQAKDPTDEQRRSIEEQVTKVQALKTAQEQQLGSYTKLVNTATKAVKALDNQFRSFANLKMPEFTNKKQWDDIERSMNKLRQSTIQLHESLGALWDVFGKVAIDLGKELTSSFQSAAEGFGEFIGQLASGQASLNDFGKFIGKMFGDVAIAIGKVAIASGVTALALKTQLFSNPYVAIAAGAALIALGTALRSQLSSAVSGASGGSSSISGSTATYDVRTMAVKTEAVKVNVTGRLETSGKTLAFVLEQENQRKNSAT